MDAEESREVSFQSASGPVTFAAKAKRKPCTTKFVEETPVEEPRAEEVPSATEPAPSAPSEPAADADEEMDLMEKRFSLLTQKCLLLPRFLWYSVRLRRGRLRVFV